MASRSPPDSASRLHADRHRRVDHDRAHAGRARRARRRRRVRRRHPRPLRHRRPGRAGRSVRGPARHLGSPPASAARPPSRAAERLPRPGVDPSSRSAPITPRAYAVRTRRSRSRIPGTRAQDLALLASARHCQPTRARRSMRASALLEQPRRSGHPHRSRPASSPHPIRARQRKVSMIELGVRQPRRHRAHHRRRRRVVDRRPAATPARQRPRDPRRPTAGLRALRDHRWRARALQPDITYSRSARSRSRAPRR